MFKRLSALFAAILYTAGFLAVQLAVYLAVDDAQALGLAAGLAALAAGIILVCYRRNPGEAVWWYPVEGVSQAVKLTALGAGSCLFISVGIGMLPLPERWIEEYQDHIATGLLDGHPALTVLLVVLLAPVYEELFFRGLVQRALMRGFPPALAVVMQAVLFAAVHGQPLQVAYVLVGGTLLGFVYLWTRSLPSVMLYHIAFNAAGLMLGRLPEAHYGTVGVLFLFSGPAVYFLLRDLYQSRADD